MCNKVSPRVESVSDGPAVTAKTGGFRHRGGTTTGGLKLTPELAVTRQNKGAAVGCRDAAGKTHACDTRERAKGEKQMVKSGGTKEAMLTTNFQLKPKHTSMFLTCQCCAPSVMSVLDTDPSRALLAPETLG